MIKPPVRIELFSRARSRSRNRVLAVHTDQPLDRHRRRRRRGPRHRRFGCHASRPGAASPTSALGAGLDIFDPGEPREHQRALADVDDLAVIDLTDPGMCIDPLRVFSYDPTWLNLVHTVGADLDERVADVVG